MTGSNVASALRMGRDALRAIQSITEALKSEDQEDRNVALIKFKAVVMSQAPALRDVSVEILDAMAGACADKLQAEVWITGKGAE